MPEQTGSLPHEYMYGEAGADPATVYAGPVGQGLRAVGGDISDIAQSIWAAGPGTLEKFWGGELEPGTPEAAGAARTTAMTYGLPGGAPEEALSAGVRTPMIGRGSEAPMFDPSLRPDVPQVNLPRPAPPAKGIPEYVQAVSDPQNLERVREQVRADMQHGGEEWYNTEALRQGFIAELGQHEGQQAYEAYINMLGPTSPNTRVPENIRNASYLYHLLRSGEGIPSAGPLPYPYGMMNQTLANARQVTESGFPLSQPKTASFSQNLMGNYEPYTWDRHISRLFNLRNRSGDIVDRPDPAWYAYLERMAQQEAQQMGLRPAAHQAGGWLAMEGVRSPREPFLATLEQRIRLTAEQRGETPQETYRKFLRGEAPLLQAGDVSGAVASGVAQSGQDGQEPPP